MTQPLPVAPRELLLRRLDALVGRSARLQRHLRNLDGRVPTTFEDWMGVLQGDEVVGGLDEATVDRARAVVAAIGRLDNGMYGVCVSCGERIAEDRLEALPETALCRGCALWQEHADGGGR